MAKEQRRQSVASSAVSDVSILPNISEDEIQALSIEQLECATEELQGLCSTLQAELDLYHRYLNSQVDPEQPSAPGLAPGSHSGSGTATPTISSLDVRGLWHGQVVTRGRKEPRIKLSEREKCQLWQRELEIVMATRRKQEKVWQQELLKCQVEQLEAEARWVDLTKARQELNWMANNQGAQNKGSHKIRITFSQLEGFMEDHVRTRLKQVSQVSVQVAVLKTELAKLKLRLERQAEDVLDLDTDAAAMSQVNYLKKQLEHEEVKTRVEDNSKNLAALRHKLETERRKQQRLQDQYQRMSARLEELNGQAAALQEEHKRLQDSSSRITLHVTRQDTTTKRTLKTLKDNLESPVVTVEEYLKLNADVHKLEKEVKRWSRKADLLRT